MCLVASGAADAYYEMGIHCWDMAGAGIIVTEAGGVLMDVTGRVAGQHGAALSTSAALQLLQAHGGVGLMMMSGQTSSGVSSRGS